MDHIRAWKLFEAAHVLAHLRADDKAERKHHANIMGKTSGRFMEAISEIVVSIFYDLPLDVSDKMAGTVGEPDGYFQYELKTSSWTKAGFIRLPCINNEAARFDRTLAVMLVNVLIEPPPVGLITGGMTWTEHDRWTGLPTLAIVAGWEGIDYIVHQVIGCASAHSPLNYVARCEDLLPPETFWYYLWLARQARTATGEPLFEDPRIAVKNSTRWRYLDEWLDSPEYMALLAQTPPLPCKTCMQINTRAEGAPKRPYGPRPTNKKDASKDWLAWMKAEEDVYEIAKNAIEAYEALWYGGAVAMRNRRARKRAHNAKMDRIYLKRGLEELQAREIAKGNLTEAGWRHKEQYLKELNAK
jgi:hypothetical protein